MKMIEIGEFTYGADVIKIEWAIPSKNRKDGSFGVPKLKIGKFCSISIDNVKVHLGGNHRSDWISTYPFYAGWPHGNTFNEFEHSSEEYPITNGDVIIENDVWICDNVTIMSGVTIGNGAIIAAGSHVVKDVKPYSIVGGNPANHIKYRFSSEVIEKLLEIQWWNFTNDRVNKIVPLLCSQDIEKFLEKCYLINNQV